MGTRVMKFGLVLTMSLPCLAANSQQSSVAKKLILPHHLSIITDGYTPEELEIAKEFGRPRELRHTSVLEILKSRFIGQPEVFSAVEDIEYQIVAKGLGRREKSEILYLMGLPSLGRSTLAREYLRAIWQRDSVDDHLFEMNVVRERSDLTDIFGSNKGYYGSSEVPRFLRWLVEHSGGRYDIVSVEDASSSKREVIVEVPGWQVKLAENPTAHPLPEEAVLFVPHFESWSSEMKQEVFFSGLKTGDWTVRNPGSHPNAVRSVHVPVTIIFGSNEGAELVAARDLNGRVNGDPQSETQLQNRYQSNFANKKALAKSISKRSGVPIGHSGRGGMPESFFKLIPEKRLLLMKPLTRQELRRVVRYELEQKLSVYGKAGGSLATIYFTIDDSLIDFLLESMSGFDFENGAVTVTSRIDAEILPRINRYLIEQNSESFLNQSAYFEVRLSSGALKTKKKKGETSKVVLDGGLNIEVSEMLGRIGKEKLVEVKRDSLDIRSSMNNDLKNTRDSEALHFLLHELEPYLNAEVVNAKDLISQLAKAVVSLETERGTSKAAWSFLFLGLSSVGKTELAKALAKALRKYRGIDEGTNDFVVVDMSHIHSREALKDEIFGFYDPVKRQDQPSKFMQAYDANDGRVTILLDEIANCEPHLLVDLYEFLREATVTSFVDGEPRKMENVIVIATGNKGQEWYLEIPRDIPKWERQYAFEHVYRETQKDRAFRNGFLESHFLPAFRNRFSEIVFFAPHSFKSIRQLTVKYLEKAFTQLNDAERQFQAWNVVFATKKDALATVDMIEEYFYDLDKQGVSIVDAVMKVFYPELKQTLLRSGIPAGSKVFLSFVGKANDSGRDSDSNVNFQFNIKTDKSEEVVPFIVEIPQQRKDLARSEEDQLITAYHEAAHAIVGHALMSDKLEVQSVSIVPGVTKISGKYLRYLGLAKSEYVEALELTRVETVQLMAKLLAGEQVERLIAGTAGAGIANDIERANEIALSAIINYGTLISELGPLAKSTTESASEFLRGLSDEMRARIMQARSGLLEEARHVARDVLVSNFTSHVEPLAVALAGKGNLEKPEIDQIFSAAPILTGQGEGHLGFEVEKIHASQKQRRRVHPSVARPKKMADINQIIKEERKRQVLDVSLDGLPMARSRKSVSVPAEAVASSCKTSFTK